MQRLWTTVTMAAWLGYCAVEAFMRGSSAFAGAIAGPPPGSAASWMTEIVAQEVVASVLLAIAGALAAAIFLLHARSGRRATAEWLGMSALALATLVLVSTAGPGPEGAASMVFMMLAASVLAVAIDRLITVEEDEDDLASFEAGIAAVAQAMARQTRLYTPPHVDRFRR